MTARQRKTKDTAEVMPETADLESLIGYNLKRAYMIVQNDFRSTLGNDGMAARVFSALSLAVQTPNITQSELARTLGIDRSGLVAIVDELEERGYVSRVVVPEDRRVQALVVKPKGRNAYMEAVRKVRDHERRLLCDFSETEKATLMKLLTKIRRLEG